MVLLNSILLLMLVVTAIAVVYVKYSSRIHFIEYEQQQKVRDQLNIEWGQLQLEQSTWATHSRIEELAKTRLGMRNVEYEKIVFIRP